MPYNFLENLTERKESLNIIVRRFPVKRTHREFIVFPTANSKLLFEIIKEIKLVSSIEIFVIFTVRTFDFTVVSGGVRLYELVPYTTLFGAGLKERGGRMSRVAKALRKLFVIVDLNAF